MKSVDIQDYMIKIENKTKNAGVYEPSGHLSYALISYKSPVTLLLDKSLFRD